MSFSAFANFSNPDGPGLRYTGQRPKQAAIHTTGGTGAETMCLFLPYKNQVVMIRGGERMERLRMMGGQWWRARRVRREEK